MSRIDFTFKLGRYDLPYKPVVLTRGGRRRKAWVHLYQWSDGCPMPKTGHLIVMEV